MHHANLEKLKSLRLFGMVRALQELTGLDDRGQLDFDDQLALLIERETADRTNAALEMRLKRARLRQAACFENLDLKATRGLDKGLIRDLFTCRWICQHRHVILTGATGTGKTWIACALGNQAAREGFSVLYTRLSRRHRDGAAWLRSRRSDAAACQGRSPDPRRRDDERTERDPAPGSDGDCR
jgi:DNA replication protein DnaC